MQLSALSVHGISVVSKHAILCFMIVRNMLLVYGVHRFPRRIKNCALELL